MDSRAKCRLRTARDDQMDRLTPRLSERNDPVGFASFRALRHRAVLRARFTHRKSNTPGVARDRLSESCRVRSGAVTVVDIKKHRRQQDYPLDHLLVIKDND